MYNENEIIVYPTEGKPKTSETMTQCKLTAVANKNKPTKSIEHNWKPWHFKLGGDN